jgi:hypothetical protein
MGEVLAFQLRPKRSRQSAAPPLGGAQILFFLGVRYVRMEDSLDAKGGAAPKLGRGGSGGKKRKSRARA